MKIKQIFSSVKSALLKANMEDLLQETVSQEDIEVFY